MDYGIFGRSLPVIITFYYMDCHSHILEHWHQDNPKMYRNSFKSKIYTVKNEK
jgi:hypothetical protein